MPTYTNRERRNFFLGMIFISPWLIGFLAFTLLPILLSFYYSFCDYSLLQPPVFHGFGNYNHLLHDPIFWKVLGNTTYYAAVALPLGLIVSLAIAVLLNTQIRGLSIYRTIVFLPSLIPTVAAAMLWLWMFNAKLGLINIALQSLGIRNPPAWLADPHWAMAALILISLWGVGNTVIIYLAGLQDVPRELYEAAELDGASPLRKLWHVTLPSISPVIFFNLVIGIIGVLQIFGTPYILNAGGGNEHSSAGPERATYFYTMYLYDTAFNYLKMGYASAMAWIQLVLILLLTALAFWSSKYWVHHRNK